MRFFNKIFCFSLFFNHVVTEYYDKFAFNAMSLGHSGLLITWKPNTPGEETNDKYVFLFEISNIDGRSDNVTYGMKHDPRDKNLCYSSTGQYKIHSLNESTLYEVIVRQYVKPYGEISGIRKQLNEHPYIIKIKTNNKSTHRRLPAKPHFEFVPQREFSSKGVIRWYPCGRESICHGQESGTHFGIIIKELSDARKMNEIEIEEFNFDYKEIHFWRGKIYDVIVYSVNGEYKTESDYQEIFFQPISTPVQYVNAISLPDSSVQISWKPPKHSLNASVEDLNYRVTYFSELDEDKDYILLGHFLDSFKNQSYANNHGGFYPRLRFYSLKPQLIYTFIIIPFDFQLDQHGLEYRMKYKYQVYNHDLPIAKPCFDYTIWYNNNEDKDCGLYIYWLPCGTSFACKDAKPGTSFSLEFEPDIEQINAKYYEDHVTCLDEDNGTYLVDFRKNVVYHVTMKSSIGSNFSEPATKIFKNCAEIGKNIP